MKIQSSIKFLSTATFLVLVSHSNIASALIFQTIGSSATAVDIYRIHCPAPAVSAEVLVKDLKAGASFISSVILKDNAAVRYTDPVGGDQLPQFFTLGAPKLVQGSGDYIVLVSHTRAEFEFYDLFWHCRRASGTELNGNGESITVIQNQ